MVCSDDLGPTVVFLVDLTKAGLTNWKPNESEVSAGTVAPEGASGPSGAAGQLSGAPRKRWSGCEQGQGALQRRTGAAVPSLDSAWGGAPRPASHRCSALMVFLRNQEGCAGCGL